MLPIEKASWAPMARHIRISVMSPAMNDGKHKVRIRAMKAARKSAYDS